MRTFACLLLLPSVLFAQTPAAEKKAETAAPAKSGAAVNVGLAAENNEVKDPKTSFSLEGDTKLFAGAKVAGAPGDYTIAFKKGDKTAYQRKLTVPSTPYRIWTSKTFRKGDAGDWTVVITGPDGAVVASTDFRVEIK